MNNSRFDFFLKIFIPLAFIATGLILLALRIPGWSLILGLPSTILGTVFLIYAYDEITSGHIFRSEKYDIYPCAICGMPTKRLFGETGGDVVCSDCKEKILRGAGKKPRE